MKTWMKLGLTLAIFAGALQSEKASAQSFTNGDLALYAGVGIGPVYVGSWGLDTRYPAVQLGIEKGVKSYERVTLGLGAVVGYQFGVSRRFAGDWAYQNYIGLVRLAAHYDPAELIGFEGIDLYLGLQAGPRIEVQVDRAFPRTYTYIRPSLGAVAGARWWLNSNIAAYGEFGYGITWANLGVAFKL